LYLDCKNTCHRDFEATPHTAERYGQATGYQHDSYVNNDKKLSYTPDSFTMTIKLGAFYRDLPARINIKIQKHPHKWHICFCAITRSSARAKSKEPFSGNQ